MKTRNVIIAAIAIAAVAAVSGYCVDARFREWDQRVVSVLEFAEVETARADSAEAAAGDQKVRGDSIAAEAASRAPEIRERIVRVREEAPPDPARDSIIDDLVQEADDWRAAYDSTSAAYTLLHQAYNSLLVVNDSLTAVLEDRPRPRSAWMPSLQVGLFAGVCSDGSLCVGAGAGLTIEVKIPTPRLPWDG